MRTPRTVLLTLVPIAALLGACAANPRSPSQPEPAMTHAAPFLMFQDGNAEEAMTYYVGLIPGSKVVDVDRYGPGDPFPEGSVRLARFEIAGTPARCTDSPPVHDFNFTPSFSFFVDTESQSEFERIYASLSENGSVMMPPDNYGFSQRFAFVTDRYGVSWQINLP